MNGKTIKMFIICAIFCALERCVFAEKTCKSGVSLQDDREGSLVDARCNDGASCLSMRVDEIEVEGKIEKDVVVMRCFGQTLEKCKTDYVDVSTLDLNAKMQNTIMTMSQIKITAVGTKGAEGSCCSDSMCNTDLLEKVLEKENPVEKSTATKVSTKLGLIISFAAVFFLA